MIGISEDETNFPHKLLLTSRPVKNLCKCLVNNLSAIENLNLNIKLSKT